MEVDGNDCMVEAGVSVAATIVSFVLKRTRRTLVQTVARRSMDSCFERMRTLYDTIPRREEPRLLIIE